MIEMLARVVVFIIGFFLLGIGIFATFDTNNGAGAAALITVGVALWVGSVLWSVIDEFAITGVGTVKKVKQELEKATILESGGEAEAAEAPLRESLNLARVYFRDSAEFAAVEGHAIEVIRRFLVEAQPDRRAYGHLRQRTTGHRGDR